MAEASLFVLSFWLQHSLVQYFDYPPKLANSFIVFLHINYIQSISFPCNLVQIITTIIELPHHRPEVRWRQVPWLNASNKLAEINLPTKAAPPDGAVQLFQFSVIEPEKNSVISGSHRFLHSKGLQGICPC